MCRFSPDFGKQLSITSLFLNIVFFLKFNTWLLVITFGEVLFLRELALGK